MSDPVTPGAPGAGRCRICGGPTAPAFSTTDRNRRLSAERFDYVRCTSCATLALANPPHDLGAYYPPDYYRVPSTRADLLSPAVAGSERAKLEPIRRLVPGGRLLEVGPAVGAFVAVAQDAGYTAEAIEMDEACCAFLEAELGVATTRSADPAAALAGAGPFDVIALWQVLEHLADPVAVLAAAAGALAPGGVLAIAAPNPGAVQFRALGRRWAHVDAPRHLFLVPIDTVLALGADHGLRVAAVTTADAAARGWNLFGWRESLAATTRRPRAARALRRAGTLLTALMAPVELTGRRGATYTVLLQRP